MKQHSQYLPIFYKIYRISRFTNFIMRNRLWYKVKTYYFTTKKLRKFNKLYNVFLFNRLNKFQCFDWGDIITHFIFTTSLWQNPRFFGLNQGIPAFISHRYLSCLLYVQLKEWKVKLLQHINLKSKVSICFEIQKFQLITCDFLTIGTLTTSLTLLQFDIYNKFLFRILWTKLFNYLLYSQKKKQYLYTLRIKEKRPWGLLYLHYHKKGWSKRHWYITWVHLYQKLCFDRKIPYIYTNVIFHKYYIVMMMEFWYEFRIWHFYYKQYMVTNHSDLPKKLVKQNSFLTNDFWQPQQIPWFQFTPIKKHKYIQYIFNNLNFNQLIPTILNFNYILWNNSCMKSSKIKQNLVEKNIFKFIFFSTERDIFYKTLINMHNILSKQIIEYLCLQDFMPFVFNKLNIQFKILIKKLIPVNIPILKETFKNKYEICIYNTYQSNIKIHLTHIYNFHNVLYYKIPPLSYCFFKKIRLPIVYKVNLKNYKNMFTLIFQLKAKNKQHNWNYWKYAKNLVSGNKFCRLDLYITYKNNSTFLLNLTLKNKKKLLIKYKLKTKLFIFWQNYSQKTIILWKYNNIFVFFKFYQQNIFFWRRHIKLLKQDEIYVIQQLLLRLNAKIFLNLKQFFYTEKFQFKSVYLKNNKYEFIKNYNNINLLLFILNNNLKFQNFIKCDLIYLIENFDYSYKKINLQILTNYNYQNIEHFKHINKIQIFFNINNTLFFFKQLLKLKKINLIWKNFNKYNSIQTNYWVNFNKTKKKKFDITYLKFLNRQQKIMKRWLLHNYSNIFYKKNKRRAYPKDTWNYSNFKQWNFLKWIKKKTYKKMFKYKFENLKKKNVSIQSIDSFYEYSSTFEKNDLSLMLLKTKIKYCYTLWKKKPLIYKQKKSKMLNIFKMRNCLKGNNKLNLYLKKCIFRFEQKALCYHYSKKKLYLHAEYKYIFKKLNYYKFYYKYTMFRKKSAQFFMYLNKFFLKKKYFFQLLKYKQLTVKSKINYFCINYRFWKFKPIFNKKSLLQQGWSSLIKCKRIRHFPKRRLWTTRRRAFFEIRRKNFYTRHVGDLFKFSNALKQNMVNETDINRNSGLSKATRDGILKRVPRSKKWTNWSRWLRKNKFIRHWKLQFMDKHKCNIISEQINQTNQTKLYWWNYPWTYFCFQKKWMLKDFNFKKLNLNKFSYVYYNKNLLFYSQTNIKLITSLNLTRNFTNYRLNSLWNRFYIKLFVYWYWDVYTSCKHFIPKMARPIPHPINLAFAKDGRYVNRQKRFPRYNWAFTLLSSYPFVCRNAWINNYPLLLRLLTEHPLYGTLELTSYNNQASWEFYFISLNILKHLRFATITRRAISSTLHTNLSRDQLGKEPLVYVLRRNQFYKFPFQIVFWKDNLIDPDMKCYLRKITITKWYSIMLWNFLTDMYIEVMWELTPLRYEDFLFYIPKHPMPMIEYIIFFWVEGSCAMLNYISKLIFFFFPLFFFWIYFLYYIICFIFYKIWKADPKLVYTTYQIPYIALYPTWKRWKKYYIQKYKKKI